MTVPRRQLRRIGVLLALFALLCVGCGGRTAATGASVGPGITDTTVKLGGSFPLSGPLSANGQAQLAGLQAYIKALNDNGGVKMADGKTRKIEFVTYDDGYDPARAVQNFRRLADQDQVLGYVGALGTVTNAAVMPVANQQQVPQIFLATGASQFSDNRAANPWTVGWLPTYKAEGAALGKYLVGLGRPLTVATLSQNDDLGRDYVAGLESAITGSKVTIVARQTHERTDVTLDSQVSALAQTKPDVLFSALAIPRLQAGALQRMQQLDWHPITLLNLLTSGLQEAVTPSAIEGKVPEVISTGFSKATDDPAWKNDPAVIDYLAAMKRYSPETSAAIPNAVWGYATGSTLEMALKGMTTQNRQGLIDAAGKLGAKPVPLLLPGITADDATNTPVISQVRLQRLTGGRWEPIAG
jgi:branched-chain amino acid transport system substrate-binding protein